MALEHLFTDIILNENSGREVVEEIAVHPEATHFRCQSGKLRQFRINPTKSFESMREIPEGANIIRVLCERHRCYLTYAVEFYSHKRNNLKTYYF